MPAAGFMAHVLTHFWRVLAARAYFTPTKALGKLGYGILCATSANVIDGVKLGGDDP